MKIKQILSLLTLFFLSASPIWALDMYGEKMQIRSTLNKHNKALKKHNIEGVKIFYDKNYKSSDGFNLEDLAQMLEKTYSSYENLKYKTKINNISLFDNYAVAQLSDETYAKVHPDSKKDPKKAGILNGKSVYTMYLKKYDDGWKIFYDDILAEQTSLKYGVANKININLLTPAFIEKGQEYDLSLNMNKPDDIIALGSIMNEEIIYPPAQLDEKFRKIPPEGGLERIVRANDKNLDEYAVASVGFTKVSVNPQETRARIEVLGMAYIMKRINMQDKKVSDEKQL